MSDARRVLSLNVGSSTIKSALFHVTIGREELVSRHDVTTGARGPSVALGELVASLSVAPDVVAHRLVHGGPHHVAPSRVTDQLRAELSEIVPFAPLHLPSELAVLDACRQRWPNVPQIVCFDTAFHRSLPEIARTLPLPRRVTDLGVRRYGFHGLSYEHVVRELGARAMGRVVIAHLGSGASLCAVTEGKSVDTTMGLTPSGGVPMGTRTGDLDPGVALFLLRSGFSTDRLASLLDDESGLLGLSGTTSDMATLLGARTRDPRAALAVGVFVHHVKKAIGALTAVLGGIDTLVFTGGIGEHAPVIREEVCLGLAFLGIRLDAARNTSGEPIINTPESTCSVLVMATDEERVLARHGYDTGISS